MLLKHFQYKVYSFLEIKITQLNKLYDINEIKKIIVIRNKNTKVYPNNKTASFFFPSINNIAGFPKTKNPVIAAEHTNSRSTEAMANIVSSFGAKFWRENINDAINII